jgi:predicted nucleic acid-binding protein
MKVLLDSDVLVAALHRSHPAHARAIPWLARTGAGETQAVVAAQSLAQVDRVLTTVSFGRRLAPSEASDVIERSVMPWCSVRTLSGHRPSECIRAASRRGVAGGAV